MKKNCNIKKNLLRLTINVLGSLSTYVPRVGLLQQIRQGGGGTIKAKGGGGGAGSVRVCAYDDKHT